MTKRDTLRSRVEGRDSIPENAPRGSFQISSGSPRSALPAAICSVIDALVGDLPDLPDYRRAELRRIQSRLRVMYALPQPKLDEIELAQHMAEEDGEAIEDAP